MSDQKLREIVGTAILGIDTLWGGDVMNPSGVGRFIADSWFSDEPLPAAYTDPSAAKVREAGGVSAKEPDQAAIAAFLDNVDVKGAIDELGAAGKALEGLRGEYITGLALCFDTMYRLAMEILGKGNPVPYLECVRAVIGRDPTPSSSQAKRDLVARLLQKAGYELAGPEDLPGAVDAWRATRQAPMANVKALSAEIIDRFDRLAAENMMPYLPEGLQTVPRANITFLPIEDAWFSGSMNYLGRARKADGSPEYEATYEINASLSMSLPEFEQLVSHEVVPGHVTTFAFLQNLYHRDLLGFEATVLTMNTRAAGLFEGIANNAILMAHGVTEVADLPDEDLQIGVTLALLQDDAKNQASWLTWQEGLPADEVAKVLRSEYLVSDERADKLSGAWGRHPLLGRMYLPAYRAGTEYVAELRRKHAPEKVLPALFGCNGLVDITTVEKAIG